MGWFPTKQERLDKKLWKAVRQHDLHKISALLVEGADPNTCNAKGETPLFVAAGSEVYDEDDYYEFASGSDYAANEDACLDSLLLLLAAGSDPHRPSDDGNTVLIVACGMNSDLIARAILEHNPDVAAQSLNGKTTALHSVACSDMYQARTLAAELIKRGAPVNAIDRHGKTPLHYAAYRNDLEMVKLLIAAGADPAKHDNTGYAPMACGYHGAAAEIVAYLRLCRGEAPPQSEATPTQNDATSGWKLAADDIVTCISPDAAGYRLTEIFNFGRATYTQISHNLDTHQETQVVRLFDEFNDKSLLETAYDKLIENGGQAPAPHFRQSRLNKKAL